MMALMLELFLVFTRIGFTSFGGLSMISLINSEMLGHGWMNALEVTDIVAIAEMTPGPLGLNCATFAGMRVAGLPGAISASLGILMPALTTTLLASIGFERFRKSRLLTDALYGIRPVIVGMVAAVIITLGTEIFVAAAVINWTAVLIAAIITLVMWKWKPGVPVLILIAAALGLVLVR